MAKRPSISIVGCGRAGGSIALALQQAGYPILAVWSRSRSGRQRAHRLLDVPVLSGIAETVSAADVAVVAVPDDAIENVAAEAAAGAGPGQRVAHTSGATSVQALAAVRASGASVASMHPLQTLPDPHKGAEALNGAPVAVTCDPADRPFLHRLAMGWGGKPFALPDDAKPAYHAAAVFASNYVLAVVHAATALLEGIGLAQGRALIAPLVRTSVDNVLSAGAASSITGPAARGDTGTLRMHVEALRARTPEGMQDPIAGAYLSLAALSAVLAGRSPDVLGEPPARPAEEPAR
ncbi:MAG TPA: Rossmann-like and DUF2520 domain-containing protein [Actinomycetota bacterium]|nr:Rossmann-like and DUF2520 domain-containing protein [Actinomycetota bacterium]